MSCSCNCNYLKALFIGAATAPIASGNTLQFNNDGDMWLVVGSLATKVTEIKRLDTNGILSVESALVGYATDKQLYVEIDKGIYRRAGVEFADVYGAIQSTIDPTVYWVPASINEIAILDTQADLESYTTNFQELAIIDSGIYKLSDVAASPSIQSTFDPLKWWIPVAGGSSGIGTVDKIQFNTADSADAALGELKFDSDLGLFVVGVDSVSVPIGTSYSLVRNATATTIPKGTFLYASGTLGASGKIEVEPFPNDNTIDTNRTIGFAYGDILPNSDGVCIDSGKILKYNTSAHVEGTLLYASTTVAGAFQTTRPQAPSYKPAIAIVIFQHAVNGILEVRWSSGASIGDDALVELSTLQNRDILLYDSVQGRFENSQYFVNLETSFTNFADASNPNNVSLYKAALVDNYIPSKSLTYFDPIIVGTDQAPLDTTGLWQTTLMQYIANSAGAVGAFSYYNAAYAKANGFLLYQNIIGGRPVNQWLLRSMANSGQVGDCALQMRAIIAEDGSAPSVGVGIAGMKATNDQAGYGGGSTVFTDTTSILFIVENGNAASAGQGSMWNSRFHVRADGDAHFYGNQYEKTHYFSADYTVTLKGVAFHYTGVGGHTLTLPSPTATNPKAILDKDILGNFYPDNGTNTFKDNRDRIIQIQNFGTGDLTLSQNVYTDATNFITVVPYSYPNNSIKIKCDGTKWYLLW